MRICIPTAAISAPHHLNKDRVRERSSRSFHVRVSPADLAWWHQTINDIQEQKRDCPREQRNEKLIEVLIASHYCRNTRDNDDEGRENDKSQEHFNCLNILFENRSFAYPIDNRENIVNRNEETWTRKDSDDKTDDEHQAGLLRQGREQSVQHFG